MQKIIEAATKYLEADSSDIKQILAPIKGKSVPLPQIPGLLKQAYQRLVQMRRDLSILGERYSTDEELANLVAAVSTCLQPGSGFSWQQIRHSIEALVDKGLQSDNPELVAASRGMLALSFAACQDYLLAAEEFLKATNTPGLSEELQWQYQHQRALVLQDQGREYADKNALQQAIDLLQTELLELAPETKRPELWAMTQATLGTVQALLGQRQSGTRNLEHSIESFQAALSGCDRETDPLSWAACQNSLGNSLGSLGHRQKDFDMLGKSIEAFEAALVERTIEAAPRDRASTLNNLAAVLQTVGQKNKDAKMLKRAVETYKEVLQVWTRDHAPLDWAATMNNMATALRLLGELRKGPRTLEQSVAAYNSALAERTRERVPEDWAMTQNNLGAALQKLGDREQNSLMLIRAVTAYESALLEWTREKMPMSWSMTMANLGVARRTQAELMGDLIAARKAVEELEAAVDGFRRASHARYSELGIDQVGKAKKLVDALAAG